MRRLIFITVMSLAIPNIAFCQKMPEFVQQRLDGLHYKAKKCLTIYRYGYSPYSPHNDLPYANKLSYEFSDKEIELIDSLGLKLHIEMIFDNEMRDRIVQLMRNEYQENELDTLVNQQMKWNIGEYENDAMEICKFDTMQLFKTTLDSLYLDLKSKNMAQFSISMYKYDVFKLLQLDTTTIFKQEYNKIVERERERKKEGCVTNKTIDHTSLIELCGYIGDKRFIKPLIEMLEGKLTDYQKEALLEALVRMRVEPYYSNYVKKRTLTATQIKEEKWLDFSLNDFVSVLGTQKAYLELSKYLLSNKPYNIIEIDYDDRAPESFITPVSQDAFYLIRDHIKNKDLQKLIAGKDVYYNPELAKPVYDWMQKNYGKYEIKRIW